MAERRAAHAGEPAKQAAAPTFRQLSRSARLYLGGVSAVASAAALLALNAGGRADTTLLVVAVVLCAAGNLFEVFAPGHLSFQANVVFFVWAAAVLPAWTIPVLAAASFLPGWAVHRFRWYKVAFNVGNYLLAGLATHAVATLAPVGNEWDLAAAAALAGSALTFVVANHVLLLLVLRFAQGTSLRRGLRSEAEVAPLDLSLAMMGACMAVLWATHPAFSLLAAGPLALGYRALWVPLLQQKSRTDPKTGLYNSEHLSRELEDELERAIKTGGRLSVVMVDLDHLRLVNNRCGHLAGDRLIRAVADILAAAVGETGIAARFGGEEYCLVLPDHGIDEARAIAERVRHETETVRLRQDDAEGDLRVTVSAGIASYPDHGDSANALLDAADSAVYDAKLGGRNRVRVALPLSARGAIAAATETLLADISGPRVMARPDPLEPVVGLMPAAPRDEDPPYRSERYTDAPSRPSPSPVFRIRWYVAGVAVLALGAAAFSDPHAVARQPWLFGAMLVCVVLLDIARIDLFERANVSPASFVVIAMALLFGVVGAVACELSIAAWRLGRRDPAVKVVFDLAALTLAGAAAAGVGLLADATRADLSLLGFGALAALAYYAVNSVLVAIAISMFEGVSPVVVWRRRLSWLAPHYVAFGTLAGTFVYTYLRLGSDALFVFALPIAMLWLAQKQYLDRSRESIDEIRRSRNALEAANEQLRALLAAHERLIGRMHRSYLSTITSLARTIEAKDPYTGGHTERVSRIAVAIADELGFDDDQRRAVEVGAIIHDIGKVGVPDQILLKAGPLEPDELAEMRRHPQISSYIVSELDLPAAVKQMVRSHHERYDGGGYPDGLTGEEIPLVARILSVADSLDAMTSDRPYRCARPIDDAMAEIRAMTGRQFCPRIVAALDACLERGLGLAAEVEDESQVVSLDLA